MNYYTWKIIRLKFKPIKYFYFIPENLVLPLSEL
jgi:hypothetical protein